MALKDFGKDYTKGERAAQELEAAVAELESVASIILGDSPISMQSDQEVTLIQLGKDGKWVDAEIHEGPYIGSDGVERFDNGSVYGLRSDECFTVFGQCYPFGSGIGMSVTYYLRNGASIRLRQGS